MHLTNKNHTFVDMKKLLLIITLGLLCVQYNQAQTNKISYVSPKKDTLILPDNDFGKLIASTWVNVPNKAKPVILFTDEDTIKRKNEMLFDNRKKRPSIKK